MPHTMGFIYLQASHVISWLWLYVLKDIKIKEKKKEKKNEKKKEREKQIIRYLNDLFFPFCSLLIVAVLSS
jgi:hypothetical protein